jgi:hypothetical protein
MKNQITRKKREVKWKGDRGTDDKLKGKNRLLICLRWGGRDDCFEESIKS